MRAVGAAILTLLAGGAVHTAFAARIPRDLSFILEASNNLTVGASSAEVRTAAAADASAEVPAQVVDGNGTAVPIASDSVLVAEVGKNASEAAAAPSNSTIQIQEPEKQVVLQPSNVTQQEVQQLLPEQEPLQANASLGAVKVIEPATMLPWWQSNWFSRHMPWTWSLIQTLSFAMVVKGLCMAGNVLVQVSPYPQVKRWSHRGDTGETDSAPYLAICFGGWQWCFYGTFAWLVTGQSGFLILVHSNCLGALLGTYYLVVFYKNCRYDISRAGLQRYLTGVAALMIFQAFCIITLPAKRALLLSGLIGSFCSFMGAVSMLVMVPAALRTKDTRSIPGLLIGANFASALVWCACGWMLGDFMVMGPNIASAMSSLTCLCLKMIYPSPDELPQTKDGDFDLQPISTEGTPLKADLLDRCRPGLSAEQGTADTGGTF